MKVLGIIAIFLVFAACQKRNQNNPSQDYDEVKEQLIEMNRKKAAGESDRIKAFVKEKKWPTIECGTGLHYFIYEHGAGDSARTDDIAIIQYRVELLDGTLCYELTGEEVERFRIGQADVESGLHEAMLYMSEGDKVHLVLPSHLAFGVAGDQSKIPQNASLVYDLTLINLE